MASHLRSTLSRLAQHQVLPMVAGNSPGTKLDGEIHRKHFGDPDLPGRSLQEVPSGFLHGHV